jgi:hypothetical protein
MMREIPNVKVGAQVAFGLFAIRHDLNYLYDEVLKILGENTNGFTFPVAEYYYSGVIAVIHGRLGNISAARKNAVAALAAADKKHSGFARHPKVGLVDQPDPELHKELLSLASK